MLLSSEQALSDWAELWDYLRESVQTDALNGWTEGEVKQAVAAGKGVMFVFREPGAILGAALVKPTLWQGKWVAEVLFGRAENAEVWQKGLSDIEAWARKYNMAAVEINGRAGWERLLKDLNYSKMLVVMRKYL
jgi:hypothetical protein